MTAAIRYTVKYHPLPIKKVSNVLCGIAAVIFVLLDLIWFPLSYLPIELKAFAILHMMPDLFLDVNVVAIVLLAGGLIMRRMQWRKGTVEWMEDRVILTGSYVAAIRLENIFGVEFRDSAVDSYIVILDSRTDAVKIKFAEVTDFVDFCNQFVRLGKNTGNIRLTNVELLNLLRPGVHFAK